MENEREATDVERLQWLIEDSLLMSQPEKVRLLEQLSSLAAAQRLELQAVLLRELELRAAFKRKALS